MPNVAGREFPYTPQGMAAADRYRQSLGMRHGGTMGFRPVGYQGGDLVEDVGNLGRIQGSGAAGFAGLPEAPIPAGPITPLVATGMGRRMAEGVPGEGDGGMSKAVDAVSSLVQEFMAQGVPDLAKEVTNAAVATFGLPVDLVNAILKSLGVPVSDTPIGGSRNLIETFGFPGEQEVTPGYGLPEFGQIEIPGVAGTRPFSIDPLVSAGAGARFAEDRALEAMNVEGRRSQDAPTFEYMRDLEKDYERFDPSLVPLREPGTGIPQSIPPGRRHGGIMSIRRR
jgi:hypothetical protein